MTNDKFRDQAALMAMQGILAHYGTGDDTLQPIAFNIAEAMLAEREKRYGKSDDGWIKWSGGECPVDPDVEVRFRSGHIEKRKASTFDWFHDQNIESDIIAYRVVGGGARDVVIEECRAALIDARNYFRGKVLENDFSMCVVKQDRCTSYRKKRDTCNQALAKIEGLK